MALIPPSVSYPGVYVQEVPSGTHTIVGVTTSVTAFIGRTATGPLGEPTVVTSFADFRTQFGGLQADSETTYAVQDFFLNGGTQALVVRAGDGTGSALVLADYVNALDPLETVDRFDLLCIPPDVRGGDTAPGVYSAAVALCEKRHAFLIVDPPRAWGTSTPLADITPSRITSDLGIDTAATSARFAAVYFPRVIKPDPLDAGRPAAFCPSGLVAGAFARNDAARGVWKAPAGLEAYLAGVEELEVPLTDAQNGVLNPLGINALRSFHDSGPVIWGARTLRGQDSLDDDFEYVPVRRLASYIEESLLLSSKWTVFEPNAEPLWAQLRQSFDGFLNDLFRQGAFAGVTKDQAYFVTCDASTTSPSDIESGLVNVVVGFAPTQPAEFLILYLQLVVGSTRS